MKIWEINHKNRYWGNKKISLEQEQEIVTKANMKDFKRYNIYMLDDGYYFIVDTKPPIDKVLWYDDETPEPAKSLNLFIRYNMPNIRFNFDDWVKEKNDLTNIGCCSGKIELKPFINLNYENSNEVYLVFYEYCGNSRRNKTTIRDLTNDEIQEILKIAEEVKKDYIERLTKYYNKFGMVCKGYWVNRQMKHVKTKHYTLYKYDTLKNDIRYLKEYTNLKQALNDLKDYYKKSQVYSNITTSLDNIKLLKHYNLVLFKEKD